MNARYGESSLESYRRYLLFAHVARSWVPKPVLGAVADGIAGVVLALALLTPGTLYPRLEGWITAFARGVGLAVTWIPLTLVWVPVLLPLGLLSISGLPR